MRREAFLTSDTSACRHSASAVSNLNYRDQNATQIKYDYSILLRWNETNFWNSAAFPLAL